MIELRFNGESMVDIIRQMDDMLKINFQTPPVATPSVETPPVYVDPIQAAPPVEVPPVVTPPVQAPPVETALVHAALDTDGYPWDMRIHAKTKTQTVKGVWKRKKGIEDTLFDTVRAETPPVAAPPVETPPVAAPPVETPPVAAPVQTAPPVAAPVETPPVTAPPVETPPVAAPVEFLTVIQKLVELTGQGKITGEGQTMLLNSYGVKDVPDLNNHPEQIPAIYGELCKIQ